MTIWFDERSATGFAADAEKSVKKFKAPKKTFGDLDAATVAHLVSASSDLVLVLDNKAVIRDVALDGGDLADYGCADWIGRSWHDVVTVESRPKVDAMMEAALSAGASSWRQVNHSSKQDHDLPVRYTVIRLPKADRVIAVGRDLRALSVLQRKLVSAQAEMENEYARLRSAGTRYQALFQLSAEAVIIIDADDMRIVEANPTASRMFKGEVSQLSGRDLLDLFDKQGALETQKLFAASRTAPQSGDIEVRSAKSGKSFLLAASFFRDESATYYLVRLRGNEGADRHASKNRLNGALSDVVSRMPDGFVVLDQDRQILTANAAFLDLVQLADEAQARGQKIERWLGRVDVDVDILIANLREYGFLRRFSTIIRGELGGREDIELSGVAVLGGTPPCFGLSLRKLQPKIIPRSFPQPAGIRSFEQLKELVGRVPLRELVRETTDIIEQMCIEAALEITGDNRASAAEMLGLSRQSLYVKLRRHGLGELDSQESS